MLFFIVVGVFVCQCNAQVTSIDSQNVCNAQTTNIDTNIDTQDVYAGLGNATDSVPFVPKTRTGTLPNGLKYYILKNDEPQDEACLMLVVNAGSVLEEDHEQGFASLVKQITFKKTKPLLQDIDSSPATKNLYLSSSIDFDETIYIFEVPVQAGKDKVKRIPQKALNILDNLTHAVTFSQKDLDDQSIILQKKESQKERNDAFEHKRLGDHRIYPILSKGSPYSPYANRLPILTQEAIKIATPSKLKDFYKRWYRADNMALVFVGDFDDAALEASLASHFRMPSPKTPLQRPAYNLAPPIKGHIDVEILTYPKEKHIVTHLYYKRQPKAIGNDLASYRQYFLDKLISYMIRERFEKISSKSSAPYTGAGAKGISFANSSRFYELIAWPKSDRVEEAIKSLLEEKERILRYGWTDSEVELAKLYVKDRSFGSCYESSCDDARSFGKHFLARECVMADYEDILMKPAKEKMLPVITTKDLTNAARDYFAGEDLTVVVLASQNDKLPSKEKIKKIVNDAKKSKVSPPVLEVINYEFLSKPPKPGSIIKETIDKETGAVILNLSNGAKVILKQGNENTITLCALAKGGTMAVTNKDDIQSARFADKMLFAHGIGPYSLKETSNKLLGKRVDLQANIDAFERYFQGSSSVKDIKTLFELIYLRLTSQKFDTDHINHIKNIIESYKRDTYFRDNIFLREINKAFYDGNPHFNIRGSNHHSRFDYLEGSFRPTKLFKTSDYPKISQKRAFKFVKKCMNPADFTFVFVGNNIDVEVFKSYSKTYIASIAPSKTLTNQKFTRPEPFKKEIYIDDEHDFVRPEPFKKEIYINDKHVKKEIYIDDKHGGVRMSWVIDEKYSLKLKAASKVLEEYINIIFDEPINHSATRRAWVYLSPFINELSMDIEASNDPKSVSAVFKQIQNIAEGNIDAEIITKAKGAVQKLYNKVQDAECDCNCDETLAKSYACSAVLHNGPLYDETLAKSYACSAVLHNAPLSEFDKFPSVCEAVSAQDLKDIAGRLLKGKYYQLILHPKHKTTK